MTVKALLGSEASATVHVIGLKNVGADALAGVTVNEPDPAFVVVRLATTLPGMTAVCVIHEPVACDGRLRLEKVPVDPPTTAFVTEAPGTPKAKIRTAAVPPTES